MTPGALLRSCLRTEGPALALGAGLVGLAALAEVALPKALGHGLDAALAGGAGVPAAAGAVAGWLALRYAAQTAQGLVLTRAGLRLIARLRERVVAHLLRLGVPTLDSEPVGRWVARATDDVTAIGETLAGVLVQAVRDVAVMVTVLVLLLHTDLRLGLAVAGLLPVVLGIALVCQRRARAAHREVRAASAEVNALAQERLAACRTVQACVQEDRCDAELAQVNARDLAAGFGLMRINAVFMPLMAFSGMAAAALVLWLGGLRVVEGTMTLGTLVAVLTWTDLLFGPIRDLADKAFLLAGARVSAERLAQVLAKPAEDAGGTGIPPREGRVEFRDVWFAYQAEDWVLRGVSFTIEPGEEVAVVGPTGAGKSTLVGLLLRLYEPQRGSVWVDGVEVRAWDRAALRRRLAPVLQEALLLAGTVRHNLGVAGEVRADTLEAVGAGAIIDRLGGLDAPIAPRGANLSAGERQLIALARAALADPAVVILDEATASLDSATEGRVQAATARTLAGRSSLIIAHRLATVRHAHRILVLVAGQVAEAGTHAELMTRAGVYAEMVRLGGLGPAVAGLKDAPSPPSGAIG